MSMRPGKGPAISAPCAIGSASRLPLYASVAHARPQACGTLDTRRGRCAWRITNIGRGGHMMKAVHAVALAALAVTLLAPVDRTARLDAAVEEPAQSVLVMFHGQANLERGRALHRRDARAQRDPDRWNYLDAAVGGTVQELEVTHRFLSDHVYSHAVRGFAARLTARQVA